MDYLLQPLINFSGLVIGKIADNDGRGPCLIICSASRVEKRIEPILIHLHFGKDITEFFSEIVPGQLVTGRFFYAGQAIKALLSNSVESITLYGDKSTSAKSAPRFPALGRKIINEAFQVLHINDFLPWEWISRYQAYPEFTRLINEKLRQPDSSLVCLDFTGILLRKIPKSQNKRKIEGKEYLCAACNEADSFELPLLTSLILTSTAEKTSDYQPKRESIFTATGVPLLNIYPEDARNIIFCGQPCSIQEIFLPERNKLLPYFYDTITDMLWGREFFWPVFYPSRRIPDNLGEILNKIRSEMKEAGITPNPRVHGWFGHGWFGHGWFGHGWFFHKTIKSEESGIDGLKLFIPTFNGNRAITLQDLEKSRLKWPNIETVGDMIKYFFPRLPARIIVVPENESRYSIKEKGCSTTISQNPEIQEGSFKPDDTTWHLIQVWIQINYQQLTSYKWDDKKFLPV